MTDDSELDRRYGRRRTPGRRGELAVAVVAALLLVAVVAAWIVVEFGGSARASSTVLRYAIPDDRSASIDFQLDAPVDATVRCAVSAKNERETIVGWVVFDVPPADESARTVSRSLRTLQYAAIVEVEQCWIPESAAG